MAHCTKCGVMVADNSAFCPNCGQAQAGTAGATANPTSAQTGMSENVAGLLCYVLGWLTGIIFLLIDKRPFVRFHAAQSIVVFGGLHLIRIALGIMFGVGWFLGGAGDWTGFSMGLALISLIGLVSLVLWIVCMVKAYQGVRFEVPIAAPIAKSLAG